MSIEINELYRTILERQANPREGSYTNQLLTDGEDEIVKKIGEESIEVILAALKQGNQRLIEETADLIYHLLVLLAVKGLNWNDVLEELDSRRR
ncbi:MAG: phosphoribosyl-ATP diphosphatase [Candidatus Promineifilaceae bacterium]|nr:phosphoribosyl-ATP diphosphatase [Candidatus Promineifilaceae bacterium]